MFCKQFWISVVVMGCAFQCTNWIVAANEEILNGDENRFVLYFVSFCIISSGYMFHTSTLFRNSKKEKMYALVVLLGMIWVSVMSYIVFYDVYRDGISLPINFCHICILVTGIFVVKKIKQ